MKAMADREAMTLGTKTVASAVGLEAGASAAETVLMVEKAMIMTTRRASRFIFIASICI